MGAKTVVIGHIARQDALEAPVVQDDDVMEHLTAHTANQSLDIWILPRTPWCDQYFFNAHMLEPLPKEGAIDSVAIAQQIPRHFVPRKCLDHLLRRRSGTRITSTKRTLYVTVGTVKKSRDTRSCI